MKFTCFPIALFVIFCSGLVRAQDIHYTQFYNTPLAVSPALTGIFNGDQRYSAVYRGQWYSANSPYTTFQAMFDQKIYNKKFGHGFMGVGGSFGYDQAGTSNLKLLQLNLTGSYTYSIDRENFVTGGVLLGVSQRNFSYEHLLWASQYNGDQVDPGLDPGETFDENGYVYGDVGVGINYRGQKAGRRSTLDIGAAVYHLNRPDQSFENTQTSHLEPRLSLYLVQYLQISQKLDLYWNGLAQLQNKYFESLAGFGGRYFLDQRRGKELAVQGGLAFRFNAIGDAAVATAELHYQYWQFGLSYDVNVSGFRAATNRNGGPEVTVRYIIHFVKPIPVFRICPII